MPIYEYRCHDCNRKVSVFFRSLSSVDHGAARCPRCGGQHLSRVMSRVRVVRGAESQLDSASDDALPADFDENDPKSMGRWMRKLSHESGEDMPPEFDEVVGRLEAGEDPESIEKSMPDLAGEGGEPDGADLD